MVCDQCKSRKAHVHVVQQQNGKTMEKYLCDMCAVEYQAEESSFSFSVHEFLKGIYDEKADMSHDDPDRASKVCTGCGQIYRDYQRSGLFGCPECYRTFRLIVVPLTKRIQGNLQHVGKIPVKLERVHRFERKKQQLQSALKDAVQQEAYEKAAALRDQIQLLSRKIAQLREGER